MNANIIENREIFISKLRRGGYKIGCQQSDEMGNPVFKSESDKIGSCACAIMGEMYGRVNGRISMSKATKALGLTSKECRHIQREINDKEKDFNVIADRIINEVFA